MSLGELQSQSKKTQGIFGVDEQARLYGQCYSAKDGKKGARETRFFTKHDAWNRRVGKIRTDVLLSGQASRRTRCDGGVGCFREWENGPAATVARHGTPWSIKRSDIDGKEEKERVKID
jgi:hypothetical protein